jgi:hypothetical protein
MLQHQLGWLPLGPHASSPQPERSYWRYERHCRAQVIDMIRQFVRPRSAPAGSAATATCGRLPARAEIVFPDLFCGSIA